MKENEETVYEILVGLCVVDEEMYQKYRAGMTPILHVYKGDFGYDFKVSKVLKSETGAAINRVFTIQFPSEKIMEAFFSDRNYKKIKDIYFENSVGVGSTTIISSYMK